MFNDLVIQSPKRSAHLQSGWDGFFPYYAGYPEAFARGLLNSANLRPGAMIFDPWNGSGTTTYTAARLGLRSSGFDLNPVMIIVARARMLSPSEADSLEPFAEELVRDLRTRQKDIEADDPLLMWFDLPLAALVRALEKRIRARLVGHRTLAGATTRFDRMSSMAATFYVALFSVCRHLAAPFRSSNPTWLRKPKKEEEKVGKERDEVLDLLTSTVKSMAAALEARSDLFERDYAASDLRVADTVTTALPDGRADFILTSPPYCTRIDYTAATRIELALLHPLLGTSAAELSRRMIGSVRVPEGDVAADELWGPTCAAFMKAVKAHRSKASGGYYYKTHADYFSKMTKSLANISVCLAEGGRAILVVQDSYYKELHNDLPTIMSEMAGRHGLALRRREDFRLRHTMAGSNPHSRGYRSTAEALEAVLCFERT